MPTYNPTVVYGAWPYPAYPPYYPYPPGLRVRRRALSFGVGMAVGAAVWGNCNWGGGDVDVNVNNYNELLEEREPGDVASERAAAVSGQARQGGQRRPGQWKHNPENRTGVQYRDQATQQRYNRGSNPQDAQSREAYRGRQQGARARPRASRRAAGGGQAGESARSQGAVGGGRPAAGRGSQGAVRRRAGRRRPGRREAGAFEGVGEGRGTSMDSARGHSSRESFGASTAGAEAAAVGAFSARGGGGGNVQRRRRRAGRWRRGGGGGGGGGGGRGGGGGGRRR